MNFAILILPLVLLLLTLIGAQSNTSTYKRLIPIYPILGAGFLVIFTQIISQFSNLSGLTSAAISFFVLLLNAARNLLYANRFAWQEAAKTIWPTLCFSGALLVFMLLSKSPFGSNNFDFVYGMQDASFLNFSSMTDLHASSVNSDRYVYFPLNWGAEPMGRYSGVVLITLLNSLLSSPLLSAFVIYAVFISLTFVALKFFYFEVLGVKSRTTTLLALLTILSPLSIYGFNNQLFGQTSGLPFTITLLAIAIGNPYLLLSIDKSVRVTILLLNVALFWIYPSQYLVILPILALALGRLIATERANRTGLMSLLRSFLGLIFIFVLSIGTNFPDFIERVSGLFLIASQTTGTRQLYTTIFNQFSSVKGPLIASGLLPYPAVNENTALYYLVLVLWCLALIVVILLANSKQSFRELLKTRYQIFGILSLGIYLIALYLIFISSAANYLLFKISTWLFPLSISLLIFGAIKSSTKLLKTKFAVAGRFLQIMTVLFIVLSASTSLHYLKTTFTGKVPFRAATYALQKDLIGDAETTKGPIRFGLPSMEETAWIAENVSQPDRLRVSPLGNQEQSLWLGTNRGCSVPFDSLGMSENIYIPIQNLDIFPRPELYGEALWQNRDLARYYGSQIRLMATYDVGSFYPEVQKFGPFQNDKPFRWSNGFFSFQIYSDKVRFVDVELPYILGPDGMDTKTFASSVNSEFSVTKIDDLNGLLVWKKTELKKGWNCLDLQALPELFPRVSPHSSRADSRPLALLIGSIEIQDSQR
jgi:hypothetical protein